MQFRSVGIIVLSSAAILLAGEFWQDKQPSDWTDKDVQRLETKSPWAKEASVSLERGLMDGVRMGGGMPGGMGGGMGRGGRGMGGSRGGTGRAGQGGASAPKMTVRWDSAAPLRDAAARGTLSEQAKKVAEWAKEYYVVTITGMTMMRGRGRDQQQSEPDASQAEQMQERLKEETALKLTGSGGTIAPERVEVLDAGEGREVVFLFPRSEAVSMDDKEVDFETAMGPRQIKVKFTLKDMIYHGKLEL